ncbi:MAG: MFS transporter [Nitrososphaerota archaeon]|jgi:OFA family oxalate/formate antiporter-like MFS transporter|nr:MFS transporter [Nitrososphaerota archaeon]
MINLKNNPGVKVLIAGSILQLFLGIIYVWSVFVQPVQTTFGWTISDVKFTVNIMLCCFVLGILTAGKLQTKLKASHIVLAGGLMMAAGVFATSLLSSAVPVWSLWITYGIVGGFGVGLAYNTIISCAQKWFPKKRGLATGISVFTFGFSSVIFAPLAEQLIKTQTFGLISTLQVLAVAFCVATLALFAFIKLPENTTAQPINYGLKKQYTTGQILKTPEFYLIFFSMMFLTAAFFIINPSLRLLAPMHGLDISFGVTLVMIAGLANSAGRLVVPVLGEKIGRREAVLTILLITAIGTASLCSVEGALFIVAIAAIAFCYGGSSGIYPLITADYFGLKNVGANYGAVMVGFMMSVLLFPNLIGQLNTGFDAVAADNILKFVSLAIVAAVGAGLIVLLIIKAKRGSKHADN